MQEVIPKEVSYQNINPHNKLSKLFLMI